MSYRILITGSRTWSSPLEIFHAIQQVCIENGDIPYTIVHGDAVGADTMAAYAGTQLTEAGWDVTVESHPADWSMGKAAGPVRNQAMVDMGADVCLSFNRGNSPGARHCATVAEQAGIPVRLYTE